MISTKPGIFEKLLRFSFLVAGAAGFLRLYGTIQQYPDILNFSQHAWLPIYLAAAGSLFSTVYFLGKGDGGRGRQVSFLALSQDISSRETLI